MVSGEHEEEATLRAKAGLYAEKVQYGIAESGKAVVKVLEAIINTCKYTSLPELNAVLRQYSMMTDRGSEGSRVYEHQGLRYRILDEQGNPISGK